MNWRSLGRVFKPSNENEWLVSHAQMPTPLLLPDRTRVFFASRDKNGKSHISYVDVERADPSKVIGTSQNPILSPGKIGTFDDSGVRPDCVVKTGNEIYLYYAGWNLMSTIPYRITIGLAVSRDGGASFQKISEGPIIERNRFEPYFLTAPWVMHDGPEWRMWYTSITGYDSSGPKPEPSYHIRYATSTDGVDWTCKNLDSIPAAPGEVTARASVIKRNGEHIMWFCRMEKGGAYKLACAKSPDGISWRRHEENFPAFNEDWNNSMQAYPAVLEADGKLYLFYNGNGFGAEGFGVLTDA